MPEPKPIVFVVDDDEAMRDAIRTLISSVGIACKAYDSAEAFLANCDPRQPGCLLLDIRMPGMSGLDLQSQLAREDIGLPVIVISGHGDIPMAVQAMREGALDFIEKPFREEDLLNRIRQAIELDARNRRERAEKADAVADLASLTPREKQVLDLVLAGKHNREIASELAVSPKTVEFHRSHIMDKMQATTVAELVRKVLGART